MPGGKGCGQLTAVKTGYLLTKMMWLDSKWFLCKGYFEVTYKFKNGNFTFIITYISEYEFQSTIRVLNSWTRAIDNNVVEELDYLVQDI